MISLLGGFIVLLTVLTAGAAWYTSRSQFCNSCHIMEPYYQSWVESSHANVPCIECHFPPGFGGKVRGKLLGLIQLAKYVTESQGPRPAAEIPDESCLRSGCHDTRLLSGKVQFKGVTFDHTPHLGDLRRGKKLRCVSCHSQMVQGEHMTVTESTCFLCHFKDTGFNEGIGACTRCHQIPEKEYDLGGGVKFTHELAYEKGVDCYNCHADVVRGNGAVPHERCRVCHNRTDDLAKIDDHVFLHRTHVTDHKIDCTDCHLEIQHSFDEERLLHAASDCSSCHPNHHGEQINMFRGVGAETVSGHAGSMMVTRVGCRSCHRTVEASPTGAVLWTASMQVCAMCHEQSAVEQLTSYHAHLKVAYDRIEASIRSLREGLKKPDIVEKDRLDLRTELDKVEHDLYFIREGGGIHNIHFADKLVRALVDKLRELSEKLDIEQPQIELPQSAGGWK